MTIDWDAAGGAATCSLVAAGTGLAAQVAVASAFTGQIWGVVGGTAGTLAGQALGQSLGCSGGTNDGFPDGINGIPGGICTEAANGCNLSLRFGGIQGNPQYVTVRKLISSVASGTFPNGTAKCTTTWIDCDGNTKSDDESIRQLWPIKTVLINGDTCGSGPSPDPPLGPPTTIPPGSPGTDPDTTCGLTMTPIDSYINAAGGMSILYEACEVGDPVACTGCQRYWYHGPGQPTQPVPPEPITDPDGNPIPPPPPDGTTPNHKLDEIKECACNPPAASIAGGQFTFRAACDKDAEGNPLEQTLTLSSAGTLADAFQALANNQVQMMAMIQQHLLWKTPTCDKERPELKGEWRTISFRSDETSPYGKSRLRKRFRYRSESSAELGSVVDYWKDFTFTSGPVCVYHKGSSVGTPQVWAASIDEGKRVIRHAFGEAGINPDQVGEWGTSSSDNPRYGVSDTMRVDTTGGYYWITARDGSNARPIVAQD